MREVMEKSSWAIPIETLAKLAGFSVVQVAGASPHNSSFSCGGNSQSIKPEITPVLIDPPLRLPFFQDPLW
jgi:hypothetical protein